MSLWVKSGNIRCFAHSVDLQGTIHLTPGIRPLCPVSDAVSDVRKVPTVCIFDEDDVEIRWEEDTKALTS